VAAGRGGEVAFFWEGNDVGQQREVTYAQALAQTCQLANYLKSQGVGRGDDVTIYMPMLPELPIAMLACARLGAVHSVVFAGFSAESLAGRVADSQPKVVITCSGVRRAAKAIELKRIVDEALEICANQEAVAVPRVVVFENAAAVSRDAEALGHFDPARDVWWQDVVPAQSAECAVEWVPAEHPLFKLYTSGSTGRPKGVVHTTAGYMVGAAATFTYVFDYLPGDVYWCTADCGWITGHSYVTYGPMLAGASQVVFEGVPTYPTAARCWEICDKYNVSLFYTAPTAIRTLMAAGDAWVVSSARAALRVLGTVGEPINPEAWRWYSEVVGGGRCAVVDTWWQTETGAHMITPLPGAVPAKPGSATLPFFGVEPAILDEAGKEVEGEGQGYLVIKRAWPSMLRTIAGDHARFQQTYFSHYKGYYFTGDGARRDADGYFWILGRVDDVINVSGHRIGTAEVESALVAHPRCAEAAVVPVDHPIKGQAIYAFVTLMGGATYPGDHACKMELVAQVRRVIGPIATPDVIHWAPALPKTRSGKIMRRILRKIANEEEDSLGDTSTLADPSVIKDLLELRGK
jgi:acetyl-CoA synthetase